MRLDLYNNDWYNPGAGFIKRTVWFFCNALILQSRLNPSSGLKISLLRLFGAKIGIGVTIKPAINIKYPWLLEIGNPVVISGNNTGTSDINNYANPTTYQISVTNGTTQFTLISPSYVSIDTVVGTTTGLTFTVAIAYHQGDVVVNAGEYYMALQEIPYYTAITNTEYWQPLSRVVEVYVGGILLSDEYYTMTNQSPVSITLDTAPTDGVDVTILVRRVELPAP